MKSLPIEQYVKIFDPEKLDNLASYLEPGATWPKNCSAVAMDMGGTNFRIGRVSFDSEGNASVSDFQREIMPGVKSEVTADEFFKFFEDKKKEYNADRVGLCFSYRAEILNKNQARIIGFSKGVQIKDSENKILNAAVLNDTTAAQLGTRGANMGLILGTGFNICYIHNGMIINSEAGRFTEFPTEDFDFGNLSEMMVSGAYLNPLIEKCEKEGSATKEEIYDRGAKIVAAEIYKIGQHYNLGKLRIAAEGAVFYNVDVMREKILSYLDYLGCEYEILDGRDKTLIGAAIAALI